MNTATNFVKNAVLKYGERYIDTGRFRPVVHVMWIIGKRLATPFSDLVRGGIETNWNDALLSSSSSSTLLFCKGVTGFVYEGYHHHKLEKLHTQVSK